MARFSDLPVELVEAIADAVAQLPPPDTSSSKLHGVSLRNPITGKAFAASRDPLLNFSKVSRLCRLASIRHAPALVSEIHITSLAQLHHLRTDTQARQRVLPFVKHVVLDFSVPLRDPKSIKLGLSLLCQIPGLRSLPQLAGLSFSSRFLDSFFGHVNHQRMSKEWREMSEQMGSWQASLLVGIANLGSILSRGGSSLARFGDVEVLFLRGNWGTEEKAVLDVSRPLHGR